ncbi:MAG: aspartate aminotransferase family protein [Okeania sp. SIO2C2]|uniref:aspartate aminotransferase family protein n=1 Tax=Okeania sp. SIO2C2 TaxID=2607787 RepID=UPI0013BA9ED6|nr:aspartate aminotransferase family protein [Okeania sp. SIO2C2]NEP86345.1 aspartate aminotransferase family protein [Okeania sp. SIO2C2]
MNQSFILPVYKRLPVAFEYGKGVWLWDTEGKQYLDGMSGIAVTVLGHSHQAVIEAITTQAQKLLHTSNGYCIPWQEKLAQKLAQLSGMEQAFFNHSGAEANELGLKISRLYGHQKGINNPKILVMEGGFHGRTLGALSASANPKIQAGFEPLLPGFVRVPYNDAAAIERAIQENPDIVAVLLEPVQGNAGIIVPDFGYLQKVRQICDRASCLMMLDEVQTGIGHTGKMFAYQHENILPDVLCLAKALGNGIPIGACLVRGLATGLIKTGQHGSTLGGNPFTSCVALTVLETIEKENLLTQATEVGEYLLKRLYQKLISHPMVTSIRGKGLMIGVELDRPALDLRLLGLEEGLLFNVTAQRVIRLLPPLVLTTAEADILISRLVTCIDKFSQV